MFYIVEQESKLEQLERLASHGAFVEVIPTSYDLHPKLASPIAIFVKPIVGDSSYIIPINHPEGINVSIDRVHKILDSCNKLFVLDKKYFLYFFNKQKAIDCSLLYSMTYFEKMEYSRDLSTLNFYRNKFKDYKELNKLIPLSLLFGLGEKISEKIDSIVELDIPEGFEFYNTLATNVFYLLEQSGLGIVYEPYKELFKPRDIRLNTVDNTVFTYYNLYNATSRPTNAFNSVNFAAIPKSPEHRKCFRPQNDYFVEFDFDGYHLRLLCDEIKYGLTDESAHKQLARQYFGKEEISDDEYNEAKQINFHAIYGKIPEKWAFLEIFTKIDDYIKGLWRGFENDGKILAPISRKPFTGRLKDMNPQKLMNYVMQSLETSRNVLILKEVLKYLKDKKTNVCLYTYDALLFDFSKEDGKETLDDIQKILEQNSKYPVKFKYSTDLVL